MPPDFCTPDIGRYGGINKSCQLSRIIWETPGFEPFLLVYNIIEVAEVCHFL